MDWHQHLAGRFLSGVAVWIFSITSLTVKLAAFARGGKSLKLSTCDDSLSRHKQEHTMRLPVAVEYAVDSTLAQ